ncbi:hypothetical protein INT47_009908 [Mucor saturninus]|uniref:Uncharacterized protein n=1 Tax=Mucor saturninus TaxID=64648 RepID=A0A8H7QUU2_9FUNG|nr:hypothetical protein INT47_009908 [Mucor saturninus]
MSYPQQVITTQPSPAYVMNSPPIAYSYPQMPSMQSYYQSNQPQMMQQQPMGYYPGGQQMHDNHSGCGECCMGLLCLGACTVCCVQCCGGGDECC